MRHIIRYPLLLFVLWFGNSCASPPVPVPAQVEPEPPQMPRYSLDVEGIEAESPGRVSLYYTLRGENHAAWDAGLEIQDWKALLNGVEGVPPAADSGLELVAGDGTTSRLRLTLDLPEDGGDFDEYQVTLRLYLAGPGGNLPVQVETVFPRIREPEFAITSIAILKDELVNTRLRVDLRIENPNIFPVTLSSFGYELYGRDRFWANGRERDVLEVPPRGFAEARLLLVMNFINMPRDLLDEVIALGKVPYRFAGNVLVNTPVPLLPSFKMDFDRQGISEVLN